MKSVTVKADPMISLSAADRKTLHDTLLGLMGLQGTVRATQLFFQIEGSTALPTDDQKRLLKWSQDGLSTQIGRLNRIVDKDLPKLNRSLDDAGIRWTPGRPIVLPRVTTVS